MSLIVCPECGNEVSNSAAACPKCGYPFQSPTVVVEEQTFVRQPEVVVQEFVASKSSFPSWIFVPMALALVLVIFGFMWMMQNDKDDANRAQANARLNSANFNSQTSTVATTETATTTTVTAPTTSVPSIGTNGGSTITTTTLPPLPASSAPTQPVTTTEIASSSVATALVEPVSDKGAVRINATITNQRGKQQPVRQEKFYLLKEDLDTILRRAQIEPENGDYSSSLGIALVDPTKRETLQQYLAAIKPYIVYSTTTDAKGAAQFKDVKPDSYYVFGVTRDGKSFAVWNTSVAVNAGDNSLALNGNATPVVTEDVADSEY